MTGTAAGSPAGQPPAAPAEGIEELEILDPAIDATAARAETHRAATIAAVRQVAALRREAMEAVGIVTQLRNALLESETFKAAETRAKQLAEQLAAAEKVAKDAGVDLYALTGEKKPAPGVGIRITRHARYAVDAALAWAREKKLFLIPEQLDAKALEKMLLGLTADAAPIGLDFSVEETPSATLATDLEAALVAAAVGGAE